MIIKLGPEHTEAIRKLFFARTTYMGTSTFYKNDNTFQSRLYEIFCDTYLSNLQYHHAFGFYNQETQSVEALMSFYQSTSEASWFFTTGRSLGNNELLRSILDAVMAFNEASGRLKFYTVMNERQIRLMRRLGFSAEAAERYDFFDEYATEAKHKTLFSSHWELLYRRSLLPVNTVVRCTFLKQEYRKSTVYLGGI